MRIVRGLGSLALLGLGASLMLGACDGGADPDERPIDGDPLVYRVPVTGVVELGLAPFIERSILEAEAAGADAVVLDIETPGGRVDAAQRIANALEDAPLPVYAYVNRRAYSAGALIALATQRVYMRQGAVMGAATPITGTGETAPEKIVSAMRSEMRTLAEQRGLDPRVAEAMVDEEIEIEGVTERGRLLTLTTAEAVGLNYAVAVEDWDDLLEKIGLPDARTVSTDENWAEQLVRFFTHPIVAPFLLSIGFLGLIIEIKTAGFGLAGAAGLVSLALFFGAHMIVGLAGWEEVILLVVGLALILVEVLVVPGFGFVGIGGILAVLAAIYLSLIGHLPTAEDYSQAALVLSITGVMLVGGAWALLRALPKSTRLARSGVLLRDELGRDIGYLSAPARRELLGAIGVAATDLRPAGAGVFGDERLDVVAEAGFIPAGTRISIISSEGYRLVVRPQA
ncbi:MAG TPA: NfeD family protein [Longimicrobiales bacterium]|nr:NfeD family protein [Longimicrobiales bacterium]